MNVEPTLRRLLEIGRSERYAEIARVAELRDHSAMLQLAGVYRDQVLAFAKGLPLPDQVAFIKSIAILEHGVGGLGSVTNLERLLSLVSDPKRTLLDWVLRNTKSYWYYSHGAQSIEDLDLIRGRIAKQRDERLAKNQGRQVRDKVRIAEAATNKLYNAVRRGDLKAVRALISKGADATSHAPDGSSLIAVAVSMGFDAIASELRHARNDNGAP